MTSSPDDAAVEEDLDEVTPVLEKTDLGDMDDVTPVMAPRFSMDQLAKSAPVPPAVAAAPTVPVRVPTPFPPMAVPPSANPASLPTPLPPAPPKSRALLVVIGAVVLGSLAGFIVFLPGRKAPPVAGPAAGTSSTTPTRPTVSPVPPSPAPPSVTPEPAELPAPEPEPADEAPVAPAAQAAPSPSPRVVAPHRRVSPAVVHARAIAPRVSPPAPKPEPRVDAKPAPSPLSAPPPSLTEEFGMNLERPQNKRPSQKLDETDPYTP